MVWSMVKYSTENKELNFKAILHAHSNAMWTLAVILMIRSMAKYAMESKHLDS